MNVARIYKCSPVREWSAGTIVGVGAGVATAVGTATHHLTAALALGVAVSLMVVFVGQWWAARKAGRNDLAGS